MNTPRIIRDGFYFRAADPATGWQSMLVTSASQAGLLIQRRFGVDAHRTAAIAFTGAA